MKSSKVTASKQRPFSKNSGLSAHSASQRCYHMLSSWVIRCLFSDTTYATSTNARHKRDAATVECLIATLYPHQNTCGMRIVGTRRRPSSGLFIACAVAVIGDTHSVAGVQKIQET